MPSEANLEDRKGFGQSLESQEDLALLCSAMTCLPHAHQKVLRWRYHEQLTFPEIAELVGRTEDAVRMQVKRAIRRLAQEMHIHDNSTSR